MWTGSSHWLKPGQRTVNVVKASGVSGVLHAVLFHVLK